MQLMLGGLSNLIKMDLADSMIHSPTNLAPETPLRTDLPQDVTFQSPGTSSPRHLPSTQRVEGTGPIRRRRTSKTATEAILKRSASTPNVRAASQNDMPSSMLNDKKRNKLGYHRTSVACVHCRRRKIRCLLAPDDPQNRCANCIRLKKECNFYPVDQQPPQERRPRTGSKADNKSNGNSSSSSSPGFTAGTSADYVDNFNSFHGVQVSTHPYALGIHSNESANFSPPGSAAPFTTNFDFSTPRNHWDQHPQYEHAYAPEDQRRAYWPQSETPVSPAYPYPSIPSTEPLGVHDNSNPHQMYGLPHPNENVHPIRSMSYSQVESLAHENDPYHSHAPLFAQENQQRRTTNASEIMPPPSLRHSASSSMVSINEVTPSTYAGAPAVTLAQAATMPYSWGSPAMGHPTQSPKATEFNSVPPAWQYGEQSHLPKVEEEQQGQGQMHYMAEPAVLYSNVPHQ